MFLSVDLVYRYVHILANEMHHIIFFHIIDIVLHPGRLTWNLQITHLERKMIFQTSMIMCKMLIFRGVYHHTIISIKAPTKPSELPCFGLCFLLFNGSQSRASQEISDFPCLLGYP